MVTFPVLNSSVSVSLLHWFKAWAHQSHSLAVSALQALNTDSVLELLAKTTAEKSWPPWLIWPEIPHMQKGRDVGFTYGCSSTRRIGNAAF